MSPLYCNSGKDNFTLLIIHRFDVSSTLSLCCQPLLKNEQQVPLVNLSINIYFKGCLSSVVLGKNMNCYRNCLVKCDFPLSERTYLFLQFLPFFLSFLLSKTLYAKKGKQNCTLFSFFFFWRYFSFIHVKNLHRNVSI